MKWIEGGMEMSKKGMFDGFDMTEIEKTKKKYRDIDAYWKV